MTHGELLRAGLDYLEYCYNLGKISYVDQMPTGSFFVADQKRKVRGHKPGTFDILVLRNIPQLNLARVMWFDAKVGKDRLSKAQKEFKAEREQRGQECYVFRSVDELRTIIEGE